MTVPHTTHVIGWKRNNAKTNQTRKTAGTAETPPPNKLPYVTIRLCICIMYRRPATPEWPWLKLLWSFRVTQGQISPGAIELAIYAFLLMVNSNILPNLVPLRDIRPQNISDLDFDLSRSLKVKCDGALALPIYGFLLMVNSNIGPNLAPLRDIKALKSEWPWNWSF